MADIRSFLPDELEREILLRLPVKSLMRFKSVSKLWRSIILDPSFAAAYGGGFQGLLLTQPYFGRFSPAKDFFYISLDGGQISHHLTVVHGGGRSLAYTGVLNGLVCFYRGNYSCLCNIATRESMELPRSEHAHCSASYHLGFEPVNKLYKVLKICSVYLDDEHYDPQNLRISTWLFNLDYSEILTVGVDASWRRIDPPPHVKMVKQAMCIDGALYWDEEKTNITDVPLIAFHLALEKFEFVPLKGFFYLPYYGPRLSAVEASIIGGDERRLFMYGKILSHRDGGWRLEHRFHMPKDPWRQLGGAFSVVAILPDGKVVLFEESETLYFPAPFYLYDPVEKKSSRIVMWRSPSPPDSHSELLFAKGVRGHLSYHEENIIPLNCLATGSTNRI